MKTGPQYDNSTKKCVELSIPFKNDAGLAPTNGNNDQAHFNTPENVPTCIGGGVSAVESGRTMVH